jgi:hypothetical protein
MYRGAGGTVRLGMVRGGRQIMEHGKAGGWMTPFYSEMAIPARYMKSRPLFHQTVRRRVHRVYSVAIDLLAHKECLRRKRLLREWNSGLSRCEARAKKWQHRNWLARLRVTVQE